MKEGFSLECLFELKKNSCSYLEIIPHSSQMLNFRLDVFQKSNRSHGNNSSYHAGGFFRKHGRIYERSRGTHRKSNAAYLLLPSGVNVSQHSWKVIKTIFMVTEVPVLRLRTVQDRVVCGIRCSPEVSDPDVVAIVSQSKSCTKN